MMELQSMYSALGVSPAVYDLGQRVLGGLRDRFERVDAENCEACAGYVLGLPERPVESITLKDCRFTFNPSGKAMAPAMAANVEECFNRGLIAYYVDRLTLDNVTMEGVTGERITATEVKAICDNM